MIREDGSATVVAVFVVGILAVLTAALGGLAQILVAGDMAQTAADAAALAAAPVTFRPFGATGSAVEEAGRFAGANGGRLIRCAGCEPDPSWNRRVVEVEVLVEVDVLGFGRSVVSASAAAEFVPAQLLGLPVFDG
ncbi:MAG: pilus assembly protein TadG-related protein [Acidimicrobiia bacterium]|nr:pilus assembly protein TadG-related protein [Acidimicrobiia bacterium]